MFLFLTWKVSMIPSPLSLVARAGLKLAYSSALLGLALLT